MNSFSFYSPTYFDFGRGQEKKTGKLVRRFGGTKVLLHFGGGSVVRSGLLDRVKKSLEEEAIPYVEFGGVKPNPVDSLVYKGIELCRGEQIDFILAVGGGSTIDSAKAIAMGVPYEGDFWDFYNGQNPKAALPVGTVLTIAAAGSEGSGDSVITQEATLQKRGASGECIRPRFSILNPELTETLPAYQTACGATDICAHVFERYFTNTKEVEITDRLCEAVLITMRKETPRVIADPSNYDARANIMWAGMVAHNNIVGVGRAQDWNSHMLEHQLSALYDCAHGAGLAVIMPAWMSYVADHHDVMRLAQMAVRVFDCEMNFSNPKETALEGIRKFREFLVSIGMPINFADLKAKEEDIPRLVELLSIGDGQTSGYVPITKEAAVDIYTRAARAIL